MKILEAIKKVLKSNEVADDLTEKIANEVEVELEPKGEVDEVETKDEVETEPVEKNEDEPKTETDEPEAETKSEGENADAPVDEKPEDEVKVEETTETTEKTDDVDNDALAKEYMAKYDEVKSALDGVSARLSSLEEALNNSGVLTKQEATEIGVGYGDNKDVEHGKSMSDILARLNRVR